MGAVATPTSWTSGTPEGEACTHKLGGGEWNSPEGHMGTVAASDPQGHPSDARHSILPRPEGL